MANIPYTSTLQDQITAAYNYLKSQASDEEKADYYYRILADKPELKQGVDARLAADGTPDSQAYLANNTMVNGGYKKPLTGYKTPSTVNKAPVKQPTDYSGRDALFEKDADGKYKLNSAGLAEAGNYLQGVWNKTAQSMATSNLTKNVGNSIAGIFRGYINRGKSPTSGLQQELARQSDVEAANEQRRAQEYSRVANQDYKQRAEQMAGAAANTAARRAGASIAGQSGAAAAALATQQQAIEQPNYGAQQELGLRMRDKANQTETNVYNLRQHAGSQRAQDVIDTQVYNDMQDRNAMSDRLSEGDTSLVAGTSASNNMPDSIQLPDGKIVVRDPTTGKWIYKEQTEGEV